MWGFVQCAPYDPAESTWDESRDAFADRCIEVLARYAPNVQDRILHRRLMGPPDMEPR